MGEKIIEMTATRFVVQIETSGTTMEVITITGSDLKFDERTGTLLGGQIDGIMLTDMVLIGKHFHQDHVQQVSGLMLSSDVLAEIFGTRDWNHTMGVVEGFDKLIGLTATTSFGFFANGKSEIQGTSFGDTINGSRFGDLMDGRDGNDHFFGAQGDDTIYGGRGDDTLDGGANQDLLVDDSGRNLLIGGAGADSLRGGVDSDTLRGGVGDDLLYGHGGYDLLAGGKGRDTFLFDFKEAARVVVQDFERSDVLVNLSLGSADEAYRDFMEHSRQVGRSVVYSEGETTVQLNNIDLRSLTVENFAGAERYLIFAHL